MVGQSGYKRVILSAPEALDNAEEVRFLHYIMGLIPASGNGQVGFWGFLMVLLIIPLTSRIILRATCSLLNLSKLMDPADFPDVVSL